MCGRKDRITKMEDGTWNSSIHTIKCMVCRSSATILPVLFRYTFLKHLKSLDPQKI